jgi:hypothetical protein
VGSSSEIKDRSNRLDTFSEEIDFEVRISSAILSNVPSSVADNFNFFSRIF